MQQFSFRATDKVGNLIQGAIDAADVDQAAERVRSMGYTPQLLQEVEPPGGRLVAPMLPLRAPEVDVSGLAVQPSYQAGSHLELQPPPIVEEELPPAPFASQSGPLPHAVALNPDAIYGENRQDGRLEPWQRGGPIPQIYNTAPAASLTELSGARLGVGAIGRQSGAAIPFREGMRPSQSLVERFKGAFIYPVFSGVPLKELAPFYRQFATLVSAGIPLHKVLVTLQSSTENRRLREILGKAEQQVMAGGMLSDAFAAYPWVFPDLHVELIRVGEQGGLFEQVLYQIADYVDHDIEIRSLISRETFYPKIVIFVALMILGRAFTGSNLAIVDLVVKGDVMGYLKNTVFFGAEILLAAFGITAFFRLVLFNVPGVPETYDRIKMSIPGLGKLVKMFSIAKFSRTFAALYKAGFGMGSALRVAGNASGNAVIKATAHRAIQSVESGRLASDALKASGVFPPMAVDMMRTGETAGALDQMMEKLADYNENEAKLKAHQVAMSFTVVVFLIVAIIIGFAVISFYVSSINETMKAGASE